MPASVVGGNSASSVDGGPKPLSLEQKKKLLWGAKKQEAAPGAPAGVVFGQNRWDQAELGSDADKLKFLRLMVGLGGRSGWWLGGSVWGLAVWGPSMHPCSLVGGHQQAVSSWGQDCSSRQLKVHA